MENIEFNPVRSFIFVDCPQEKNRHKLQHWMYYHHVPESMAKFGPFVTKYTYYWALPVPDDGERFGGRNFCLTEHYWLVNPNDSRTMVNALSEYFPPEAMVWQGHLPDRPETYEKSMFNGDDARATEGNEEDDTIPFVYIFMPFWWEEDLKGASRTLEDGYNYRWLFTFKYPDGVSLEQGDKWFFDEMMPTFCNMPQTTRILTSRVKSELNDSPYQRVVEIWFEDNEKWLEAVTEGVKNMKKPEWATVDSFPFLKPQKEIVSLFLSDLPGDDHYSQYHGYQPRR
ncbi:MAG: acetyl-CoA hydrolase [Eubacterium sp.]|nr:acetyl-CoA hydrolase [Eubacterium sp.]